MKKIYKYLILSPIILACSSGLSSCSNKASSERFTLKIINSEDYIYLNDGDPSAPADMVDQFKAYIKKLANTPIEDGGIDPKFRNVDVVYDTSDTNETLYSELQTGKSDYDLINVSDYMAQKMASENLIVPLFKEGETRAEMIPNYETYASKKIRNRLDEIKASYKWRNPETKEIEDKWVELKDYAVGYMWGTLGILFNPEYSAFSHIDPEEVKEDMHYSFSGLWNKKYQGTISIKNSMRDTYAVGLMHAYEEEFIDLIRRLNLPEEDEEHINQEKYMELFSEIFNRCKPSEVNQVKKALDSLKQNIFGLEVDSGKQDIVTGKIGVNLAWSGDAVYAMDQAEDPELVGKDTKELYYCVPEIGSNLWFDAWVMPKNGNRSEERRELALMFLDFISNPENASQNMDYTGYTSFIGGDSVLELVRDWYDIRTDELYVDEDQIYAVGPNGDDDFFALDYDDCMTFRTEYNRGHKDEYNEYDLYSYNPDLDKDKLYTCPECGMVVSEKAKVCPVCEATFDKPAAGPKSVNSITKQESPVYVLDEEGEPTEDQKKYGDLLIADEDESLKVDLSYFFNNTLDVYGDDYDTVFYSDSYLIGEFTDPGSEDVSENVSVGRQFFTQYPDERTLNRCAVMRDYGENNKYVMKMWEEFKSDPLPIPAIIIFVIIIAAGLALAGFLVTSTILTNRIRKKRLKAAK